MSSAEASGAWGVRLEAIPDPGELAPVIGEYTIFWNELIQLKTFFINIAKIENWKNQTLGSKWGKFDSLLYNKKVYWWDRSNTENNETLKYVTEIL